MKPLIPILLFLLLLTACSSKSRMAVPPVATAASIGETELAARVKTALLNDPVVGMRRIDVAASGDQITLTGRVASAAERDRAVSLARAVAGVRGVTASLDIQP